MKKNLVSTLLIAAGIGCFACSKSDNHSPAVTGANVRVVTPDVFVKLVKGNLGNK